MAVARRCTKIIVALKGKLEIGNQIAATARSVFAQIGKHFRSTDHSQAKCYVLVGPDDSLVPTKAEKMMGQRRVPSDWMDKKGRGHGYSPLSRVASLFSTTVS